MSNKTLVQRVHEFCGNDDNCGIHEYCEHLEQQSKRYREILKDVLTEYGKRKYGLHELLESDSE